MSDKIIVLVADLDNTIHGEINILEGAEQAARFVETLIESGFEQERIRVFYGGEVQMEVHHRPVVSLGTPERTTEEVEPSEQVAESSEQAEDAPQPTTARSKSLQMEEVSAEPFIKNGVRFSTQFRPA